MEFTLSAINLFVTILESFAWGQIAIVKHFPSFFMTVRIKKYTKL